MGAGAAEGAGDARDAVAVEGAWLWEAPSEWHLPRGRLRLRGARNQCAPLAAPLRGKKTLLPQRCAGYGAGIHGIGRFTLPPAYH